MSITTTEIDPFLGHLIKADRADVTAEWLVERRENAFGRLGEIAVPGRKDEEWRFMRLKPLTSRRLGHASFIADAAADLVEEASFDESQGLRLVVSNGFVDTKRSDVSALPSGAYVGGLSGLPEDMLGAVQDNLGRATDFYADDLFRTLNTASFGDVVCVVVPPDTLVEQPIHLLHVVDGVADVAVHPRVLVVAGRGSKFSFVEEWRGDADGSYFTNTVTEVYVAENANVSHLRVQREHEEAAHISRLGVAIAQNGHYDSRSFSFGARLSRNDLYVRTEGEGAWARLDGLAVLHGEQESDTHSVMDNGKPNCNSHQLHKVVADGKAHGVFNGKIFVREGAQKISAYQLNRNLLLSNKARVDTKPQLEIFADDVECSHGATIGQLDDEQQFYLQSRGVPADEARAILTYAFAAEVVEGVTVPSVRDALIEETFNRTQGR
jgi:Fe-S cluster assembly protein SufD